VKIHPGVRPGRVPENNKVKTGQRTNKKGTLALYFTYVGEAPANDNATKFGTGVDVRDVITRAKFEGENLRGSDFTVARILAFSIDFAYGP